MAKKPKVDRDERFSLYPSDPEDVLRRLLRTPPVKGDPEADEPAEEPTPQP